METELDLQRALARAQSWAREAGALARSRFRTDCDAQPKHDDSLVTEVDLACQELIIRRLQADYPDHDIIAEEAGVEPPRGRRFCWVIDPLDGTRNFARGVPMFSVAIAVMDAGQPRLGVVFDPIAESCYAAGSGLGAWANDRPLQVSRRGPDDSAILGISARRASGLPAVLYGRQLSRIVHRNLGSCCLLLALTAAGSVDVCFGQHAKLWDLAAGSVLICEAGGTFTSASGAAVFPIESTRYGGESLDFLAGNPALHGHVLETLRLDPKRP